MQLNIDRVRRHLLLRIAANGRFNLILGKNKFHTATSLLLCDCNVLRDLKRLIMKQDMFYRPGLALNIRTMIEKTLQEKYDLYFTEM